MAGAAEPSRQHSSLSSVASAARLLKAFAGDRQEMGVTEAARHLGLGKSTAHRLLNTLAEEGLLEQDERTGAYRLGLAVYELGRSVSTYTVLHEVCVSVIDQLRAATKGSVQVAVLDGHDVVYIERRESPLTLRLFGRTGHRLPANVTASGKLLLAFLPPARLEGLLDQWVLAKRTDHSIDDVDTLLSQLDVIRERGWAENVSETENGIASIAAPIFNADGDVAASVSAVFLTQQLSGDALRRYARPCLDAGLAISRRLGYRTPTEERQSP
jgi:IclR family KDG regulon transcriptional repressor